MEEELLRLITRLALILLWRGGDRGRGLLHLLWHRRLTLWPRRELRRVWLTLQRRLRHRQDAETYPGLAICARTFAKRETRVALLTVLW